MRKRWRLFLTILGVTALAAGGCAQNEKNVTADAGNREFKELHIGYPSSGSDWAQGTLGVAEEYGYLDEYLNPLGYDAVLTSFTGAAPAIHEAYVAGELDFASYAGFAGIAAAANGIDTKLLDVVSYGSTWQLVVNTESRITDLEDLRGKKIAYQRGATPQMYVLKVLQQAGLTENDAELLNCNIPEGISGLTTGAVDAAVVSYGQTESLVQEGKAAVLHTGVESEPAVFYEPSVLTGRTAYIEENPQAVTALIQALLKAKDKIKEDPDAYYKLASEKSGLPLNQVQGAALDDQDLAFPNSLDEPLITSLENIQKFELENGIISQEVDFDTWIEDSFLEQAKQNYEAAK